MIYFFHDAVKPQLSSPGFKLPMPNFTETAFSFSGSYHQFFLWIKIYILYIICAFDPSIRQHQLRDASGAQRGYGLLFLHNQFHSPYYHLSCGIIKYFLLSISRKTTYYQVLFLYNKLTPSLIVSVIVCWCFWEYSFSLLCSSSDILTVTIRSLITSDFGRPILLIGISSLASTDHYTFRNTLYQELFVIQKWKTISGCGSLTSICCAETLNVSKYFSKISNCNTGGRSLLPPILVLHRHLNSPDYRFLHNPEVSLSQICFTALCNCYTFCQILLAPYLSFNTSFQYFLTFTLP